MLRRKLETFCYHKNTFCSTAALTGLEFVLIRSLTPQQLRVSGLKVLHSRISANNGNRKRLRGLDMEQICQELSWHQHNWCPLTNEVIPSFLHALVTSFEVMWMDPLLHVWSLEVGSLEHDICPPRTDKLTETQAWYEDCCLLQRLNKMVPHTRLDPVYMFRSNTSREMYTKFLASYTKIFYLDGQ
jgi:hypothetical protein